MSNFIDVLTRELRAQSKRIYLFEEINKAYKEYMVDLFQKAIRDELFSAASYTKIAQELKGFEENEISEEFIKHAKEESGDHFYELMEYASKVGIIDDLCIKFDFKDYDMPSSRELDTIFKWKQDLEYDAYRTYIEGAKRANYEGDLVTAEFFRELAKDEFNHISDLLKFTDIGKEYIEI